MSPVAFEQSPIDLLLETFSRWMPTSFPMAWATRWCRLSGAPLIGRPLQQNKERVAKAGDSRLPPECPARSRPESSCSACPLIYRQGRRSQIPQRNSRRHGKDFEKRAAARICKLISGLAGNSKTTSTPRLSAPLRHTLKAVIWSRTVLRTFRGN